MSFPMVLLQPGVRNETQDTELTTIKLTPNAHSNFQTRFVIPKQGSVLDSNSALVWRIDWNGYDASKQGYQRVALKHFSGGLPTLRRARFYIGGREVFSSQDVGHLIHIKRLATNPDYLEEVVDKEIGSQHGFFTTTNGKYEQGTDAKDTTGDDRRFVRSLGSGNKGMECSVLLSDIFSALESLQLPMDLDTMRLELDWETDFDEVATIMSDGTGSGNDPITDKTISIKDPVLLLDYLTFNDELKAGLGEVLQSGMVLPYIHTSMSEKIITGSTATKTDDVLIALQGKLLMKMYVSQRFANVPNTTTAAYQLLQGRCRSQRGKDQSYNLFINDLAIHDLPVDTSSEQYSFLEMTHQGAPALVPGSYEHNADFAQAVGDNQENSGSLVISGLALPNGAANTTSLSAQEIRDGIANTTSYIGFDLAKYDEGSRVVPANAGYRVGSAPVIFRITQDGGATTTPEGSAKVVQVFTEEVRMLQVRGGVVDTMEA